MSNRCCPQISMCRKIGRRYKRSIQNVSIKKKIDTAMVNENQQKTNKSTIHNTEIYQILILTNNWQKIKYEIMQLIITTDYQAWSFEKHIHNVTGLNMFVTHLNIWFNSTDRYEAQKKKNQSTELIVPTTTNSYFCEASTQFVNWGKIAISKLISNNK